MRAIILASLAAAILPESSLAQANPDSPENIVVTATRVPSKVENLPAGVTVIDRKTIEERGYVSLVDALSAVPGLRVVQSGGPGAQTSLFVRGTNSNHVLVLRDGIPINDPSDPGGAFNFGVDTLNDVERIEVIRGPASSAYGSGAIGGVINLITRHGAGAPHGHISLAGGAPSQLLAQADVSGGFGIYDYAADVQGFSTRGFDVTPRRIKPVYSGEVDGDRSKLAQLEVGATPFQDTRFSVLLRGRDAKYGFDEQGYDAGNATGYDASLFGRVGVTSKLFDRAWETSLFLTGLVDDRLSVVTYRPQDPNQQQNDDRYHGRRADVQWNNIVHLPDHGALTGNDLTFGYEHVADEVHARNNDFSPFSIDVGDVRAHADSDAGYLGLQTTLLRRLALTGQVREDATTLSGDAFTWRLGGVLDVAEIASHFHASYGTSFRAPALNDLYGRNNFGVFGTYVGNPHLHAERGQSWEAGITTDLPQVLSGNESVSVTYFHNRLRDLIEFAFLPDGLTSTVSNVENAQTQGVEATFTLRARRWLQADLTYTYTDARNLTTPGRLLRIPYDQASGNVRITPIPSVTIAPELVYTGGFRDFLTSDNYQVFEQGLSPSGLIFNLNVTWQATPALQVFAWGKNLGNSRFEPANGYQAPGASFLAGARVEF